MKRCRQLLIHSLIYHLTQWKIISLNKWTFDWAAFKLKTTWQNVAISKPTYTMGPHIRWYRRHQAPGTGHRAPSFSATWKSIWPTFTFFFCPQHVECLYYGSNSSLTFSNVEICIQKKGNWPCAVLQSKHIYTESVKCWKCTTGEKNHGAHDSIGGPNKWTQMNIETKSQQKVAPIINRTNVENRITASKSITFHGNVNATQMLSVSEENYLYLCLKRALSHRHLSTACSRSTPTHTVTQLFDCTRTWIKACRTSSPFYYNFPPIHILPFI